MVAEVSEVSDVAAVEPEHGCAEHATPPKCLEVVAGMQRTRGLNCVCRMDAILTTRDTMTMDVPPYVVDYGQFEVLYRREYPGLFAVATAMCGGMNAADDLVQDAMVKALVNWQRVQRLDRPGGWCHRVLLNICRNWYRRRRIEANAMTRFRRREFLDDGPSGEAIALCQAMQLLATRPRAAVALYHLGDRSISEIASILAVPEGTVRSDLTRARVVLCRELGM